MGKAKKTRPVEPELTPAEREIKELEARINAIRNAEHAAREERRKTVTPVMRYTFGPSSGGCFDKILDPTVVRLTLRGECTNMDVLQEAGWSASQVFTGSMDYLFNTLSGKVVMAIGGGSIFVTTDRFGKSEEAVADGLRTFGELAEFIIANPEGGDVTAIIEGHRARTGK